MPLSEDSRRLVLRYNPGQFTFRHIGATATDEQLYNLARQLNSFQLVDAAEIHKVRTYKI